MSNNSAEQIMPKEESRATKWKNKRGLKPQNLQITEELRDRIKAAKNHLVDTFRLYGDVHPKLSKTQLMQLILTGWVELFESKAGYKLAIAMLECHRGRE